MQFTHWLSDRVFNHGKDGNALFCHTKQLDNDMQQIKYSDI
jgi:hypothetical protein